MTFCILAVVLTAGCATSGQGGRAGDPIYDAVEHQGERQMRRQGRHVNYRIEREIDEEVDPEVDRTLGENFDWAGRHMGMSTCKDGRCMHMNSRERRFGIRAAFVTGALVGVLLGGCSPVQNQVTDVDPRYDNFEEDFPAVREQHSARPEHKALAYGLLPTNAFIVGWGYGKSSQDAAIAEAFKQCRTRMDRQPASMRGHCVLYSVDGQRRTE